MGLFDKLFPKKNQEIQSQQFWQLLNGYSPVFSSFQQEIYEAGIIRASIDSFSRHASKLEIDFQGSAKPELINKLKQRPNDYQTWSQLLARISNIYLAQNTCFIVPILGRFNEITGLTTLLPMQFELIQYNGEPWVRFTDWEGKHASIELWRVGILVRFQYKNDLFGSNNNALNDTMTLLEIQQRGIQEGIKNSNSYRFAAQTDTLMFADDLKKERERFSREHFSGDGGGLLLFPKNYNNIMKIDSRPVMPDAESMRLIQQNVYDYYGTNSAIIQNSASIDQMDAYYNGMIEPFMIQLQEVLNKMLYSYNERSYGNSVVINSNRLQYMNTAAKVSLATNLGDRGCLLVDEIRQLFNYSPLPNGAGQVTPIRGEYKSVGDLLTTPTETTPEITAIKNGE